MEDVPYLTWLHRIRRLCMGSGGSTLETQFELEASACKELLTCCCERWAQLSCSGPTSESSMSIFEGKRPATVPIQKYGEHLSRYLDVSPVAVIGACVYIFKMLNRKEPVDVVSASNIHRLLLTALMLSSKFFDDGSYENAYFAEVGGVSVEELNSLEVAFLFGIDFRLNLTEAEIEKALQEIVRVRCERRLSQKRKAEPVEPVPYSFRCRDPVVNEFNEPQPVFSNADVQPVFTCSLKHSGDLIVGMTLEVELPQLDSAYPYVSDLGYRLIDELSISVAGVELDRMTGLHMLLKAVMSDAHSEYSRFGDMLNGVTVPGMLDSEAEIQDGEATTHKLVHVPIPFWFARAQVSNGFPLASLITAEAIIKLKLSPLSSIIQPPPDVRLQPRISILTDNVWLDPKVAFALIRSGPSKSLFQQNLHQDHAVDADLPVQRIELTCNKSVRRLLWLVTASDDPNQILPNSVLSSRLILEGYDLMSRGPVNQDTGERADGKYSELV
ncbi:Cyclin family protein [Klebsormidium nitens]|uniref:Cyclin family protein n=1 Tax=Klebsormidium nitens TaxID=105231 RepID=A0A1Y1ISR3_KLENI|nr:Cyclin family protein [Klebsormidium nitens]|eukprot:GAQ91697.1 Cyclin family protein [Klebsormidium nitens]